MSELKENEVSPQMQEYINSRKPKSNKLVIPEGVSPEMKQYLEDQHKSKNK